jgi:hypothetical protein
MGMALGMVTPTSLTASSAAPIASSSPSSGGCLTSVARPLGVLAEKLPRALVDCAVVRSRPTVTRGENSPQIACLAASSMTCVESYVGISYQSAAFPSRRPRAPKIVLRAIVQPVVCVVLKMVLKRKRTVLWSLNTRWAIVVGE